MINPKKQQVPQLKCTITECVCHENCAIIEIVHKIPKNAKSCSYFKDKIKKKKND